jgi:hypothetical protein
MRPGVDRSRAEPPHPRRTTKRAPGRALTDTRETQMTGGSTGRVGILPSGPTTRLRHCWLVVTALWHDLKRVESELGSERDFLPIELERACA